MGYSKVNTKAYPNLRKSVDKFIEDYPDAFDKNDKRQKHLYFYEGTAFPFIVSVPYVTLQATANDMILDRLKDGESLNDQINEYIKELDRILKVLEEGAKLPDLPENMPDRYLERNLNTPFNQLASRWVLAVCALIKLKKIDSDNLNGVVVITPKKT